MFVEALARSSRADTARLSIKQATSQLRLQIGEVAAESGDRDPLALGHELIGRYQHVATC